MIIAYNQAWSPANSDHRPTPFIIFNVSHSDFILVIFPPRSPISNTCEAFPPF